MNKPHFLSRLWFRGSVFILFLISVNLLAGYIAVKLDYPSLYNVDPSFEEYAIPLPFSWGLEHIPTMLLFGLPLLFLYSWEEKHRKYYRVACAITFLLLLLELDEKIPFLLFPKIDAVVAFFFSLIVAPPNRRENPRLMKFLQCTAIAIIIGAIVFAYSAWSHRTPVISVSQYAEDAYTLKSIKVYNDFRKTMVFDVDLVTEVPESQACTLAQTLAIGILEDYPFDNAYSKRIEVTFRPTSKAKDFESYNLGEISLNTKHKDESGRFACYLKFKH